MSETVDRKESKEADPGAALESIIAKNLINHKQISPTKRCILKQKNDKAAVSRIDKSLKKQFDNAAIKIAKFVEKVRVSKATKMNDMSSRSHAIMEIKMYSKNGNNLHVNCMKIIDLAGSERIAKLISE